MKFTNSQPTSRLFSISPNYQTSSSQAQSIAPPSKLHATWKFGITQKQGAIAIAYLFLIHIKSKGTARNGG